MFCIPLFPHTKSQSLWGLCHIEKTAIILQYVRNRKTEDPNRIQVYNYKVAREESMLSLL